MSPGLIIVSNRLPVSVKKTNGQLEFFESVGGLSMGLASYATDKRNKWIGWPGVASDDLTEKQRQHITEELLKRNCYPVFLTQKQLDGFYNGYSNRLIWPLFHDVALSASAIKYEASYWKAYSQVNQIFADTALALSGTETSIWVHDYQLMLVPAMLRAERPEGKIGFFSHIPFPEVSDLAKLSQGAELIAGVLGSDLVGFHIMPYADNFTAAVTKYELGAVHTNKVVLPERVVRVTDFPIGIDYAKWRHGNRIWQVRREYLRLCFKYWRKKLVITVDRLDPTKGLVERAAAYQTLLRENPGLRGKISLVMIAVPSRTDIEEYKNLREHLETLVSDINQEFGTARWQPVDYQYASLPFEKLRALYQRADVAFIVPLKDGMNLVAKEYLASKSQHSGVLVLSKTAGAAEQLKDAIMVDPNAPQTVVDGLKSALELPKKDLRRRVNAMQNGLATATIHTWASGFMGSLRQNNALPQAATLTLNPIREERLVVLYGQAIRRLILLDYDGVLTAFTNRPDRAKPSAELIKTLTKLAADPANMVVISSGRTTNDMDTWLAGIGLNFSAEHGAFFRESGSTSWKKAPSAAKKNWQKRLLPILERYAKLTPGAMVEIKSTALVWHYRAASPYYAQKNLVILKRILKPLAAELGVRMRQGHMILEIKPADISKATIAYRWLRKHPDFVMAIGDDYTDEDAFRALPADAFSIKVGRGRSAANYRLKNVEAVSTLLKRLSKIS